MCANNFVKIYDYDQSSLESLTLSFFVSFTAQPINTHLIHFMSQISWHPSLIHSLSLPFSFTHIIRIFVCVDSNSQGFFAQRRKNSLSLSLSLRWFSAMKNAQLSIQLTLMMQWRRLLNYKGTFSHGLWIAKVVRIIYRTPEIPTSQMKSVWFWRRSVSFFALARVISYICVSLISTPPPFHIWMNFIHSLCMHKVNCNWPNAAQ